MLAATREIVEFAGLSFCRGSFEVCRPWLGKIVRRLLAVDYNGLVCVGGWLLWLCGAFLYYNNGRLAGGSCIVRGRGLDVGETINIGSSCGSKCLGILGLLLGLLRHVQNTGAGRLVCRPRLVLPSDLGGGVITFFLFEIYMAYQK